MKLGSFGVPFGLAGMSVGMGMLGEQLGSTGLTEGAEAAGAWVSPAVNITAGSMAIKQLKGLRKL